VASVSEDSRTCPITAGADEIFVTIFVSLLDLPCRMRQLLVRRVADKRRR
jgi:hypothetical protein